MNSLARPPNLPGNKPIEGEIVESEFSAGIYYEINMAAYKAFKSLGREIAQRHGGKVVDDLGVTAEGFCRGVVDFNFPTESQRLSFVQDMISETQDTKPEEGVIYVMAGNRPAYKLFSKGLIAG